MAFALDTIVPWGRSYDEYVAMFALSKNDLANRIIGCGDGPAAFNAGHTTRGGQVVSVDPLYRFSADDIRRRIGETCDRVIEETRRHMDEFVWDRIRSVEHLREMRMAAMETFLADYTQGLREGRYVEAALPSLPYADGTFDLALCSHYLFLYSEHVNQEEHCASICELVRVASEARIFPLLELGARPSRHRDGVVSALEQRGYTVQVRRVNYEFQKGGNEMMVVTRGRAAQGTIGISA